MHSNCKPWLFSLACAGLSLGLVGAVRAHADAAPRFGQDVLPILAEKCFQCHGPDGETRKAGLRLDQASEAIVPGDRKASALYQRITATDDDDRMPPAAFPKTLSAEEVEILGRWIDTGATYEQHWAFVPLGAVAVPTPVDAGWGNNEIDAFVLTRLEEKGLHPSPEADRRTLIRRLSFDLLGLPPTPQEVADFESDPSPTAYEDLAARYLASPRYGERWARHWLDVAHYGESHGYDKDKRRPHAWPYRDYVIHALNDDKPYGQFVAEQVAGDVLYPDEPQATVALGFLAAGPWDFVGHVELREGTVDKDITRMIDRDDVVSTVMNAFTGLTVQCARCHDHKFDPISQADYFSLQAVFSGVERANRRYDRDAATARLRRALEAEHAALKSRMSDIERQINAQSNDDTVAMEAQLSALRARIAAVSDMPSPSNGYHSAIAATADAAKWVQVDLGAPRAIEGIRLVPAMPTDFAETPGFGFPTRFTVEVSNTEDFHDATRVADFSESDYDGVAGDTVAIDARATARFVRVTALRLWERTGDYVFALAELEVLSSGENLARGTTVTALDSIDAGRWHTRNLTDGFSSRAPLGSRAVDEAASIESLRAEASALDATLRARRVALLPQAAQQALATTEARLREVEDAIKALPEQALVYAAANDFQAEGSFTSPPGRREIHVLRRGDVRQPAERATPGTVGCIDGLPSRFDLAEGFREGEARAALAAWLTSPENPLTWRNIVNRVWHYHFGRGIVETPNDFGRMGATPTHPELLDWLARRFLEEGQSLKWLHRVMVTSATYRQAVTHRADYESIDGSNQYLWRANRRQLEAEALRDAVLAVSGKLDFQMGGPSFDTFVFEDDHSPRYLYEQHDQTDARAFRRSVYAAIVRSVPDPFLTCLDAADPSQSVPVRNQTLTALQALAVFNDAFVARQSAYLAERLTSLAPNARAQLAAGIRHALAREPRAEELEILEGYADAHGLAAACRVLLNSNEFMFVD